jgi:polysaccharide export outer membrane protein
MKKNKNLIIKMSLISLIFCLSACHHTTLVNNPVQTKKNKQLLVAQYLIGVDDLVQVDVWKHPDLTITVPVRPDGIISVPLIGEILAGGKTPNSVAIDIQLKLSKYIKQPNVSVILKELRSHEYLSRVRVTGAVRTPLSLTFRQGMTILDVVLAAGGLNDFASANSSKLFRRINGKITTLKVRLDDILVNGNMKTNYSIEPGDIVTIPERIF